MKSDVHKASQRVTQKRYRSHGVEAGWRQVAEELPIAFSFSGTTYAVMMASPQDLEDFVLGFCLTEQIIASKDDLIGFEIVDFDGGIDIQIRLKEDAREHMKKRVRRMAGPVGCGLCGIESIEEALRPAVKIASDTAKFTPQDVTAAIKQLSQNQPLNMVTRAVHAAAFYIPNKGLVAVREDVGRHNALDKLAGALAQTERDGGKGAVAVTSRVSVEMVQKTAAIGSPLLIAISAPTALALSMAERAGITIAALVRGDEFELFTHPENISEGQSSNVA
jgi:FdhD protein